MRKSDDKAASCSQPKQTVNQAVPQAAGRQNIASRPSGSKVKDYNLVVTGHPPVTQQGVKRRSGGQSVNDSPQTSCQGGVDAGAFRGLGNAVWSMVTDHGDTQASESTTRPVYGQVLGFTNKKLTECYSNTVTTALLSLESFSNYLMKNGTGLVTSEMLRLLKNHTNGVPAQSLATLRAKMPKIGQDWTENEQKGASEFVNCMLNSLEEEAQRAGNLAKFNTVFKLRYLFKPVCPGGHLSEENNATSCPPPFIPDDVRQNVVNIYLDTYLAPHQDLDLQRGLLDSFKFDNDDPRGIGCKCSPNRRWTFKPYVSNAPDVLTIAVARFRASTKLMNRVLVPEYLNLPAIGEDVQYTFVAASVHIGDSMFGGHYMTIVKNGPNFLLVNDSQVSPIDGQAAHNHLKNGYVYYYVRLDPKDSPVKKKLKTVVPTTEVDKYLKSLIGGKDLSSFGNMPEEKINRLMKLFNIPPHSDQKVCQENIREAVRSGLKSKVRDEDKYRKLLIQLALKPKKGPMAKFTAVNMKKSGQPADKFPQLVKGSEGHKLLQDMIHKKTKRHFRKLDMNELCAYLATFNVKFEIESEDETRLREKLFAFVNNALEQELGTSPDQLNEVKMRLGLVSSPIKKLQATVKNVVQTSASIPGLVYKAVVTSKPKKKRSPKPTLTTTDLQEAETPVKDTPNSGGRPAAEEVESLAVDMEKHMSIETRPIPDTVTRQLIFETPSMDIDTSVDELSREMSKSLSVCAGVTDSMESLDDSTAGPKIKQDLLTLDTAKCLLQNVDSMSRMDLITRHQTLMNTQCPEKREDDRLKASLRAAVLEWTIRELTYSERRRVLDLHGVSAYKHNSKLLGQLKGAVQADREQGQQILSSIVRILTDHQREDNVDIGNSAVLVNIYRTVDLMKDDRAKLSGLYQKMFGRQLDIRSSLDRPIAKIKKHILEKLVEKLGREALLKCQLMFKVEKPHRGNAGKKQLLNKLKTAADAESFLSNYDSLQDDHTHDQCANVSSLQQDETIDQPDSSAGVSVLQPPTLDASTQSADLDLDTNVLIQIYKTYDSFKNAKDLTDTSQFDQVYRDVCQKERDKKHSILRAKKGLQKEVLAKIIKTIKDDNEIKDLLKKVGKKPKGTARIRQQLLTACDGREPANVETLFQHFNCLPEVQSQPATDLNPVGAAQGVSRPPRPAVQPSRRSDSTPQPVGAMAALSSGPIQMDVDPAQLSASEANPEDSAVTPSEARSLTARLDRIGNDELHAYYKRFGSRSASRRRAIMLKYVQNAATTKMIEMIPKECIKSILKEFEIPFKRAATVNSILRHAVLTMPEVLATVQNTFDRIEAGEHVHDFQPYRFHQLTENQEELKRLRSSRIQSINNGLYTYANENPILQKGRVMEEKMQEFTMEHCTVCQETWFEMNINERTQICERCTKLRRPNYPDMYSDENNMIPGPQPRCLQNLTLVETLSICPYRGVLKVIRLRGGGTRIVGHAVTVGQDVGGWTIRELPRPPQDIPIILMKSPHQAVPFTASRAKIRTAIEFLIRNNPVFKDFVISTTNLDLYPEEDNGPVEGLSIIEQEAPDFHAQEPQDAAEEDPEQNVEEHHGEETTIRNGLYESAIGVEMTGQTKEQQIMSALQTLFPDEEQVVEPDAAGDNDDNHQPPDNVDPPTINWPQQLPGLVSEFEENFFVLCYPHLFPYGKGDISSPRTGETPKRLLDWLNHLCHLREPDDRPNRFASDPRFLFHVINIYQRRQGQTLAAVFVDKILDEVTSFAEVKEKLQDPTSNYSKCFASMSSQIKGGSTYFYSKRRQSLAFEKFIRIQSGNTERFNLFLTLSLADNHMTQLHRLLPGSSAYLGKTVVEDASDMDPNLFISKAKDAMLRQEALAKNGHIVNAFVTRKLEVLKKEVLQEHCGVMDWIIRSEYQARSALHWHIVARVQGIDLNLLEEAFTHHFVIVEEKQKIGTPQYPTEADYENSLANARRNGSIIVEPGDEDRVKYTNNKVNEFATTTLGLSAVHPENDWEKWPVPFGNNEEPPAVNPLRVELKDVQDQKLHYNDLCNRVLLHTCRPKYCYDPEDPPEKQRCRHGFPKPHHGFTMIENDEDPENVVRFIQRTVTEEDELGASIDDYNLHLIRNHTRLVQHIPEILSVWQANTDAKLIKDVPTLIEYVIKVSSPFYSFFFHSTFFVGVHFF